MSIFIKNQISEYIQSLGIAEDWHLQVGSEHFYIGQIILDVSLFAQNRQKFYLENASEFIALLIDTYYSDDIADNNLVVNPKHYNAGKIEVLQYLGYFNTVEDFCIGSIIKYMSRYRYKGTPLLDLKKAEYYINYLIKK